MPVHTSNDAEQS
jgi:hypothetical protein